MSALAVLRRPDVFAAAIAGAPVSDWRWYDTVATERWLGHPGQHPDAYDRSSLLPLAAGLTRPLLFVHGLADDNVHPRHSLLLSRALAAAGRDHELLLLPGVTHVAWPPEIIEQLLGGARPLLPPLAFPGAGMKQPHGSDDPAQRVGPRRRAAATWPRASRWSSRTAGSPTSGPG